MTTTYKIIRFRQHGENTVVARGLTEAEAQAHCGRDDTHGEGWFDGYDEENPDLVARAAHDKKLLDACHAVDRLIAGEEA